MPTCRKHLVLMVLFLSAQLLGLSQSLMSQEPQSRSASNESWITFLSHRSGENLLYRMRPDGAELAVIFGGQITKGPPLTNGARLCREPHWSRQSPDRGYFLSWATDVGKPESKYNPNVQFMLFLGATNGGWSMVVEPNAEEVFAWSPDSKRLAIAIQHNKHPKAGYLRAGAPTSEIVLLNIDRTSRDVVLDCPGIWCPSDWSPDGKQLLLQYSPQLASSARDNRNELYELDLVAFEQIRRKHPEMLSADAVTLVVHNYLKELTVNAEKPRLMGGRYSPDGKYIASVRYLDPWNGSGRVRRSELVLIERANLKITPIAASPVSHAAELRGPICWSPDGKRVLFSRRLTETESEPKEKLSAGLGIWSVPVEGGESTFVTTGWSPDWR